MKTTIKHLLVFGFASVLFLGCATQPATDAAQGQKYEYRTEMLRVSDSQTTRRLSELNSQGWVIASVDQRNGNSFYTFKRLKQ